MIQIIKEYIQMFLTYKLVLSINILLCCWFLSRFKPIQWLVEDLLPTNFITNLLSILLSCSKCIGFWFTLIYTHDFFYSCFISFLMMIYEKTIGKWENKVKFK